MHAISLRELEQLIGSRLGVSAWFEVTQERIDQFAAVTEDREPIHLDAAVARRAGFDGPIAHGFLSLALLSAMSRCVPSLLGQRMIMNYGFDRARFLAPIEAGSRVRSEFVLAGLSRRGPHKLLIHYAVTVFSDRSDRPVLSADWLAMAFHGDENREVE